MMEVKSAVRPLVLAILCMGGVLAVALAAGSLGVRWDPFGWDRRRLEQAQARMVQAEAQAAVRTAEAVAVRAQAARLETHWTTMAAAAHATEVVRNTAGDADDALISLETGRADRLRAHDRELCRLVVDLDGCAAAAGLAGDGAATLRPGDPAR